MSTRNYTFKDNKEQWLNQSKLVIPDLVNETESEKKTKVVVSGESEISGEMVVSNVAVISQQPESVLKPSEDSVRIQTSGGTFSIRIDEVHMDINTIKVVSYPSFISSAYITIENDIPYLNAAVSPNVTSYNRSGLVSISGIDEFGNVVTNDSLSVSQTAGSATVIVLPEAVSIKWDDTTTAITYSVIGGSLRPGSVKIASISPNFGPSSVTITEGNPINGEVRVNFTQNTSYFYEKTYTVSISGVSTNNEFVYSDECVITQAPRQMTGTIRLVPSKDVIGYYETSASFAVKYPDTITDVGFVLNQSVNVTNGSLVNNNLMVTVEENSSTSQEKEITVVVSGRTEENVTVYGYYTITQTKKAILYVGDSLASVAQIYDGSPVTFSATNKSFFYKSENLSNIGLKAKSTTILTCDVIPSTQTVKITFERNESTTSSLDLYVELSGVTSDGHQEVARYNFTQNKKTNDVLDLVDTSGGTEVEVSSDTEALSLRIVISGYTNVQIIQAESDKAGSSVFYPQVGESFTGTTDFVARFSRNYSYSDVVTYRIKASGTTSYGTAATSNEYTIVQSVRQPDEGRFYFGTDENLDMVVDVASSGTSVNNIAITTEGAIKKTTIEVDYEASSGLTDDVNIVINDTRLSVSFPAYPCEDKTYTIVLKAQTTAGIEKTSLNALVINQAQTTAVDGTGIFTDSGANEIIVECSDTTAAFKIFAINVDTSVRPTFIADEGCWFIINDQWEETTEGGYTHYIQSVANIPVNTKINDGTIDVYNISCTIKGLGCSEKTVFLALKQRRCIEGPVLTIEQYKVDNVISTDVIPFTASTVTWKVNARSITAESASISVPVEPTSYILDVDGVSNETPTESYESVSNLVRYATLWKVKATKFVNGTEVDITGESDTGSTYVEQNSGVVQNTVKVAGYSIVDSSEVSGETTVSRVIYNESSVFACPEGGKVILEYNSPYPEFTGVSIVTGGTMCNSITIDETTKKIVLDFAINYAGDKTLTLYLEKDGIKTNTLRVVQTKTTNVPSLSIDLDTNNTTMTDDGSCIELGVTNTSWIVNCEGMAVNSIVIALTGCTNVLGGSGTNPTTEATFNMLASLTDTTGYEVSDCDCDGKSGRKIKIKIEGLGLDGITYTAQKEVCQTLEEETYDLRLFAPHNIEFEGGVAYFSVGSKNVHNATNDDLQCVRLAVEVLSGEEAEEIQTSNILQIYNTTGTGNTFGNAEYSLIIPKNVAGNKRRTTTTIISPTEYSLAVGNNLSEYQSGSVTIICGEDSSSELCLSPLYSDAPRVMKFTAQGYNKKRVVFEDYAIVVQKTYEQEVITTGVLRFLTHSVNVAPTSTGTTIRYVSDNVSGITASGNSEYFTVGTPSNGRLNVTYSANTGSGERTGEIVIMGTSNDGDHLSDIVTITQSCGGALSWTEHSMEIDASTRSIIVGFSAACIDGLSITSNNSDFFVETIGTNTATIRITEPQSAGSRTVTLTISGSNGGNTLTDTMIITQGGACMPSITWSTSSATVEPTATTLTLNFTATCATGLTITYTGSELPITYDTPITGNSVTIRFDTNESISERSTRLRLIGYNYGYSAHDEMLLTQGGVCQPEVAWSQPSVSIAATDTAVTLNFTSTCASGFTITSSNAQFPVTYDSPITGNSVVLKFAASESSADRSTTLRITGFNYSYSGYSDMVLTQSSVCTPSLAWSQTGATANADDTSISLGFSASCATGLTITSSNTDFPITYDTPITGNSVVVRFTSNENNSDKTTTLRLVGYNQGYSGYTDMELTQHGVCLPTLEWNQASVSVSAGDTSVTLGFTATCATGLTVVSTSAEFPIIYDTITGNSVTVRFAASETSSDKSTTLRLTGYNHGYSGYTDMTLTQTSVCTPTIAWNGAASTVTADSTSVNLGFTASCASGLTITSSSADFPITYDTPISGNNVVVRYSANESSSPRSTTLRMVGYNFEYSGYSETVLTQNGVCLPSVTWNSASATTGASATSITLGFTASCATGITVTSNGFPITYDTPTSNSVTVRFSANTSVDPRSTILTITGYNFAYSDSDTFTLEQSGMEVTGSVTLSGNTSIPSTGGTYVYTATTNYVTWSGAVTDDANVGVSSVSGASSATTGTSGVNVTFKVTFPSIATTGTTNITISSCDSTSLSVSVPGYQSGTYSGGILSVCKPSKTVKITVKTRDKNNVEKTAYIDAEQI